MSKKGEKLMKSTDKVLVGIVVGILLLIVVALAVTMTRPEPTYMDDGSPESATHNYLLALQKEDYARAYGYLSPTVYNYPSSTAIFKKTVEYRYFGSTNVNFSVGDVKLSGKSARVKVTRASFSGGDLFDTGQRIRTFWMELELEGNDWKLVDSDSYFANCWKKKDRDCY
jgi:hypothetical protein